MVLYIVDICLSLPRSLRLYLYLSLSLSTPHSSLLSSILSLLHYSFPPDLLSHFTPFLLFTNISHSGFTLNFYSLRSILTMPKFCIYTNVHRPCVLFHKLFFFCHEGNLYSLFRQMVDVLKCWVFFLLIPLGIYSTDLNCVVCSLCISFELAIVANVILLSVDFYVSASGFSSKIKHMRFQKTIDTITVGSLHFVCVLYENMAHTLETNCAHCSSSILVYSPKMHLCQIGLGRFLLIFRDKTTHRRDAQG